MAELFAVIGLVALLIGGVWLLVTAFQKSIGWGIAALLLPFAGLIFGLTHWDRAKAPLSLSLIGLVSVFLGSAIGA